MRGCSVTYEHLPLIKDGDWIYTHNLTTELADIGHKVHKLIASNPHDAMGAERRNMFVYGVIASKSPGLEAPTFWFGLMRAFRPLAKPVGHFDISRASAASDPAFIRIASPKANFTTVHHIGRTVSASSPLGSGRK